MNLGLEVVWLVQNLNLSNPSVRLRSYSISDKMNFLGTQSRIISEYYTRSHQSILREVGSAQVVVFTQCGEEDYKLLHYLKERGKKTVFDHCEAIFGLAAEDKIMAEVDLISCCSTKLAEITNQHGFKNTVVLKDPIEDRTSHYPMNYANRYTRPRAVYMGMGGNSFLVEGLRNPVANAGYDLVLITEWGNATVKWNPLTWPDDMTNCDVALCPQHYSAEAKSHVKAVTAMALGLPVIASPTPSYKELIKHGENGYIADSVAEWQEALVKLKDPELRQKIGRAASGVIESYSLRAVTKQWVQVLGGLS